MVAPRSAPTARYERAGITVGIVHLGVGGFHRAHQALYVDELLERGGADEWGICGVGLLPGDAAMRDALAAHDGLYTLVVKHADGSTESRVVGSLVRYLFAPEEPDAVLDVLTAASTRIVSLTITEGGYDGAGPAFPLLTEALRRRRDAGTAPFVVMSCDNLPGNGGVAREALTSFSARSDPDLSAWISAHVAFPDSMVDRITPVTTDADRDLAPDPWPVVCEDFRQWVLEDRFPAGRPSLEDVGVQLVVDVEPFELMKLRLLNASHQALAHAGHLLGHHFVHDAARDPALAPLVRQYMAAEGAPSLPPVPGVDLDAYQATLMERFTNPAVADTIPRLCADSSHRIPTWLVPVIRENLAAGRDVHRSAFVVACWARYAEGVDESGRPIEVVDADRDRVMAAARSADALEFLRLHQHFGDLADQERFVTPYLAARARIRDAGTRAALLSWTDVHQ